MNADGLVASLTFGGSPAQGAGFAMILIVRYVLETCSRVAEAVSALRRIPVALSQNVTILDKTGEYATVYLDPQRSPVVGRAAVCANHQEPMGSGATSPAVARSIARQEAALQTVEGSNATLAKLLTAFLMPPIYSRSADSPTVYSAVYRPAAGTVDYVWPGKVMTQWIGGFRTGEYVHDYGALTK